MLLFDVEADNYLEDATRIWCIVAHDTESGEWYRFGPDEVEDGVRLVSGHAQCAAHNGFGFDFPLLSKLCGVDWSSGIGHKRMVDTLVLSRLAYPDLQGVAWTDSETGKRIYQVHSIEAWGRRLKVPKGEFNEFSKWDPAMLDYCEQDVRVMAALVAKIQLEAPWALEQRCFELEHEFARNIQDMMWRGAPYDEALAEEILEESSAKQVGLQVKLSQLHPGWQDKKVKKEKILPFNPSSRPQITRYFKEKYDWQPTQFTDSGAPQVSEDILEALPWPEAKEFAELFRLTKLIASLSEGDKSWKKNVVEGRIHGFVCHNGTPTGRCRHSGPNLGNIPRRGDWLRCRSLFRAGDGNLLVGADASSLELVILAHYLSYWDGGEYAEIVTSGDPHSFNQEAAGLSTRDAAKTLIYAFLYGAGDRKLGTIVSSSDDDGVLSRAGRALRRKFLAAIPALGSLLEAVKSTAKSHGRLVGLDGRHIPIRSPHAALNYLGQGGGAVVMKRATNLACRQVSGMVLHVHDEMQFEVPKESAEEVGEVLAESIRQAGRDMGLRLPLDAEYKVGETWKSTH